MAEWADDTYQSLTVFASWRHSPPEESCSYLNLSQKEQKGRG